MKLSALIILITASIGLASPAAVSLNRPTRLERDENGIEQLLPCVECECNGWTGVCKCVKNGCCCTL
ncbi:hypothetical protein BDV95DRAFT_601669 [Massariosphaeria phaeospora]|uniref:Invertebrate defensins family profile domain-containing protein n=1 Tax=Massariosphaeria phaeospora TaxID=100035 RepID=A0A7C8MFW8_9PLEO|nr:hypothetical protein BDV95DRAFT_601669 [Massariosphaeria phaeospora]